MAKRMELQDLNIYYGDFLAVQGVDMVIEPRAVTAFIGPSGCGKSTVLRSLDRMLELTPGGRVEGKVLLDGQDIYAPNVDPVRVRQQVGMVFQQPNPFPTMSIRDNVLAGIQLNARKMPKAHKEEVVERSPFGSKQEVKVIRDKQPRTLSVEVKSMPKKFGVAEGAPRRERREDGESFASPDLGLDVGEHTPELAKQLGVEGQSGVVITGVAPNGLADEAGLREGMLILRVGRQVVKSVADFQRIVKAEDIKSGIMFLVRTPSGNRFVVLQQR